jgi:murein DD-endopeptidase MepM/ murein hydrolase activator NlpD
MQTKLGLLESLSMENQLYREKFRLFSERLDALSRQLFEINAFDHQITGMSRSEKEMDEEAELGIGGFMPPASVAEGEEEERQVGLVLQLERLLADLEKETDFSESNRIRFLHFLEEQKRIFSSLTPNMYPTQGRISSVFGYRRSPFTGKREKHQGIDIAAKINAPVVAPADGVVENVGWEGGYGRVVSINHGFGLVTKYAHLRKSLVRSGQKVKRGDKIALVGNSGRSTGPHLHYELRFEGVPIDPAQYIREKSIAKK